MGEQNLTAKELGAYYTPEGMVRTLCSYAVRTPFDTVLDPSCGEGIFLANAVERLLDLGADPRRLSDQVAGVEIQGAALARAQGALLSRHPSLRWGRLARDNFFDFAERLMGKVTFQAVVGNPPYIRFQNFGDRDRARHLAERAGVSLNGECASWAPFVAVAASFVAPGGRLAMVLPREHRFVNYAKPLLKYLEERFGRVRFTPVPGLPFDALQKVSLLFAEDAPAPVRPTYRTTPVDEALRAAVPLDRLARVRLGIVTGAKPFFVLSRGTPEARRLHRHLKPVIASPSRMKGLTVEREETDLLLTAGKTKDRNLARYVATGEAAGLHERYKCRIRSPWYAVPDQPAPDAFLSYCAGEIPRLALNRADARATNNLHGVWWRDRRRARTLTLAFHNWLTLLSIERIGRVYGGGVLKIEPGDASRILLPLPSTPPRNLFQKADADFREGRWRNAVDGITRWLVPEAVAEEARREWERRRAER